MKTIETIDTLEDTLAGTLRPVAPRKEFVHGLGNRIQRLRSSVQHAGAGTWKFILLTLAGLLSLGVLLAFLGRMLFNLFATSDPDSEQA
jgi:hypothetical protein